MAFQAMIENDPQGWLVGRQHQAGCGLGFQFIATYRLYSFRRIIQEIPEIEFWSLFTHGPGQSSANLRGNKSIRMIFVRSAFHSGDPVPKGFRLSAARREWRKGKRMIQWMKQHKVRAVIVAGYNDLGSSASDSLVRPQRNSMLSGCRQQHSGRSRVRIAGRNETRAPTQLASQLYGGDALWLLRQKTIFAATAYPTNGCSLVPYESDFSLFQRSASAEIERLCLTHGLAVSRKRLVYGGRLVDVKRVDLLIDAFVALAAESTKLGFADYRRRSAARIPAGSHSKRVSRPYSVERIRGRTLGAGRLYRCCDVLVLPSDVEPWG